MNETYYGEPVEKLDPSSKLDYETAQFGQAVDGLLRAWVAKNVEPGTNPELAQQQYIDMLMKNIDINSANAFIASAAKSE